MGVFSKSFKGFTSWIDPAAAFVGKETGIADYFVKQSPPTPPGVPNQNQALQDAQAQTDAMRQRRGLLANIYAGNSNTAPVSGGAGGKTQLGA